ncbi:MAG TPA: AAA family ATPase [Mycobacterium sp.]|uniref:AAA family ATPase n=1 Tax=Mycobacterium sp. TaxID=1785 RepID=UPI002D22D9CB|nr:AAA family ATPase [Mycobacterium sp.]HZU49341.1 AAA family ATPase [Mycobacterium sp.]
MRGVWPLIGRSEELRLIGEWVRRRDTPAGVVLAGSAGVGKTRLAREAVEVASRRGAAVRWAVATASARMLPLGAFIPLLGELGPDPSQLLRNARAALVPRAPQALVVIGVDDAHLLDDLSALLVHQLVSQRVATVVVTVRSGEPAPDAITALWKDGHLPRLDVQPLSESETATLAEAVLGGQLDSGTARRLWSLTGGNPLYLHHLLDGEREAGRLHRVAGVWCWSGELSLSPGLTELLAARMGTLSGPVGVVLDMLALAEPLDIALLAELCDPSAVEEAEDRGLMATEQVGPRCQARLAHPLYGEVRRAGLGRLRARRLRGQIATKLATADFRRGEEVLRRAVLMLDSDGRADPGLYTTAARTAMNLLDLPLAERLGQAAVAGGGGFDFSGDPDRCAGSVLRGSWSSAAGGACRH